MSLAEVSHGSERKGPQKAPLGKVLFCGPCKACGHAGPFSGPFTRIRTDSDCGLMIDASKMRVRCE